MKNISVRLISVEINNFKNVVHGEIKFEDSKNSDCSVLGLYGQNGSGKTALIDALFILKNALSGLSIPDKYADYINTDDETANFKFCFSVKSKNFFEESIVYYSFDLSKIVDETGPNTEQIGFHSSSYSACILNEVLSCSYKSDSESHMMKPYIDTRTEKIFLPDTKYKAIMGEDEIDERELLTLKNITASTSRSFIFSKAFLNKLRKKCTIKYFLNLIECLIFYGNFELFVIDTTTSGLITLNALPISFKYDEKGNSSIGSLMINLNEPTLIPQKAFDVVVKVIQDMNIVLNQLVPGLTIGVKNLGNELMSDSSSGVKIQLMSNKNSKEIPLKYESEGIKKIVSILQLLIVVYNKPSITVAIDELDSGVFEYLLGELLRIISEKGKGQLIFTSHNLRPLETLDRHFVAFTTVNPKNRYIRLVNIKTNNNLRDFYYRDIILGEQKEAVYESTNNYEIALAFRQAGEMSGT